MLEHWFSRNISRAHHNAWQAIVGPVDINKAEVVPIVGARYTVGIWVHSIRLAIVSHAARCKLDEWKVEVRKLRHFTEMHIAA